MIKVTLDNAILKRVSAIDQNISQNTLIYLNVLQNFGKT